MIAGSAAFPPVPRFRKVEWSRRMAISGKGEGKAKGAAKDIIKCPGASREREAG